MIELSGRRKLHWEHSGLALFHDNYMQRVPLADPHSLLAPRSPARSAVVNVPSSGPLDRDAIARQEQNAAHPGLLRVANFGVLLSGALFAFSLIAAVVMFMNAREQWQRESAGNYHATSFRVLQSYWEKRKPGPQLGDRNFARASARGLVEGKEEWMDLAPYIGFTPQEEATVLRAVPPGTVISVYYDPGLQGDYRVRLHGSTPPGTASHNTAVVAAKYGSAALAVTGILLFGFIQLRKFSLSRLI